ncbi:MAG: hypothetical protein U5L01_02010, partial [Rheinheimera sp.]|nr:hypothetical protein [Rheinheimera sp.]
MVAAHLRARKLGVETGYLKLVTTGDKQTDWSLEAKGGKGLFTTELEQALLRGEADVAVHSTKDLPGDMPEGLGIGGYMPREDARDILVLRSGVPEPKTIATGSPPALRLFDVVGLLFRELLLMIVIFPAGLRHRHGGGRGLKKSTYYVT